jgi:DNA-binding XRE family transcriptional regulator
MSESLYVCLFSNGHIKVGRSIKPASRIGSHCDRVACMGVTLVESRQYECAVNAMSAELALIRKCTEAAATKHQNEWFSGLDFLIACEWAEQASTGAIDLLPGPRDNSFGERLRQARRAKGLTQAQLGEGMGRMDGRSIQKAAVCSWEAGNTFPNVPQLRLLCERLEVSADELIGLLIPA